MAEITSSPLPPRVKDITGQKFGRLTVIRFVRWQQYSVKRHPVWECLCECGKTSFVTGNNLKTGHTKSCGCWGDESRVLVHTKHGDNPKSGPHPLYTVWSSMKQRCEEKGNKLYPRWGGRGIKIEWKNYEAFRADMLSSYKPGLTIERKDNNGPYSKENCRWATYAEQNRNRRTNVEIEFHGIIMCVTDWAEVFGMKRATLAARLKSGWSVENALTVPVFYGNRP